MCGWVMVMFVMIIYCFSFIGCVHGVEASSNITVMTISMNSFCFFHCYKETNTRKKNTNNAKPCT